MKINRFIVIGVIALLVVGALGFVSVRALAHGFPSQERQAQVTEAPDTDNVEEQVGDQNEADTGQGDEENNDAQETGGQEAEGTDQETDQAALQAQAQITIDAAQQTALDANPGTTVVKAELDDENGTLVYSIELSNGLDVKVDASTGQILNTEPGE